MLFTNFTCLVPFLDAIFFREDGGKSSVYLLFYDMHNSTPFFNFSLDHSTCDIASKVNLSKKIITYIHGWENALSEPDINLMSGLIEKTDDIIIRVEYPYNSSYAVSFFMVNNVGSYVGDFFMCLNHSYNYPLDNIRVIGHSLGAHISGVVGKTCNGLLKSIIGLDPAGPLFNTYGSRVGNRLAKSDSKTVEVIHTSNVEGTYLALGKSDFYVNGGSVQPQCGPVNTSCNHFAAVVYYTETILYHPYVGTKCSNKCKFRKGLCNGNDSAYMGGIVPDPRADGIYYLTT